MTYHGGCQCGAVAFEADGEIAQLVECNCSICKPKGYLLWFVPEADFRLKTDEAALTEYRFNTHKIRHLFCATCGVQSYGEGVGPDGREMRAINVRCLDDVQLDTLRPIPWDGASH